MSSACTMVRTTVLEIARIAHHSNIDGLKVMVLNKLNGITLSGVNTASQKIRPCKDYHNAVNYGTTQIYKWLLAHVWMGMAGLDSPSKISLSRHGERTFSRRFADRLTTFLQP